MKWGSCVQILQLRHRGIERSLRAQHVLEGQHVEFETYMLEEKLRIGGRGYNDYCNRMKGNTTVAEYTHKFDDLCRFSKICQGNPADFEEWKCLKFEGGLPEDLMSLVVRMEIRVLLSWLINVS
ncbi:uncharacterized protein LOC107609450 isoform X2 [Arachis ipaensis]|uniref:uncharacterized protein LOC107609450 isoform X2 n=1 Tax=Arachis ipaensis TaxID=130454 RepID=UPI000A2AF21B|nr:uncharacterized protein LOC107609450 isoform X2 [Arachis ipaensis]